jgi:hypothetical protein
MPDLVVVSANLHNETAAVEHLAARSLPDAAEHFDVGLVSEAHRRRSQLRRLPGHTYLTGPDRGPSQEVGILLGNHLPNLGHSYEFLSPEAPAFPSVGKERWGQDVVTEIGDIEIALITYHPVAGPDALHGDDPDHPLVRRYAKATRWLDATIEYHQTRGREVAVGSDCQMREGANQPWSPKHVLARHHMKRIWSGIDVLAFSSGLVLTGNPATQVQHEVLHDHPLIRAEFNLRGP